MRLLGDGKGKAVWWWREVVVKTETEASLYLLSVNLPLLAVSGLRSFHEPPLDLQIHRHGCALEGARHFYVLALFNSHVGRQVRKATCGPEKEKEG